MLDHWCICLFTVCCSYVKTFLQHCYLFLLSVINNTNTFGSSFSVTQKMRKMWEHSCFFAESEATQTVQQGPLLGRRATAGRVVHVWNCLGKFDFKNTEKKLPFFLHSHWIKARLWKSPISPDGLVRTAVNIFSFLINCTAVPVLLHICKNDPMVKVFLTFTNQMNYIH